MYLANSQAMKYPRSGIPNNLVYPSLAVREDAIRKPYSRSRSYPVLIFTMSRPAGAP